MKTSELGGFAAMRRESKDEIQIVSVSGDVDLYSAHRLGEVISRAKSQADFHPPRMVVDLSEVEFMDTAGLEVLLEECSFSRQVGRKMCLVAQEGPITRLLELTGLKELFHLYDELGRAVDSCTLVPA
jgi:anti-sigma B factor antagonist